MTNFNLNLLSDEIPDAETARQAVVEQSKAFRNEYFSGHPERASDRRLGELFRDLENGRFWGVLYAIDGFEKTPRYFGVPFYFDEPSTEPDSNNLARTWARQNFTDAELQRLLNISANVALLGPFQTGWPGTYKGHSILYMELQKPDSMFYGIVDENLRRRFNNGRFWEELPNMFRHLNYGNAYRVVDDVLVNNFGDLSIGFVPKGFEIFYRNNGAKSEFDLRGLSDEAVDNYVTFVSEINSRRQDLNLSTNDIELLVRPYAHAIIDTVDRMDGNGSVPRFGEDAKKGYQERLQDPLVTEYLVGSDLVRRAFAKQLQLHAVYGHSIAYTFDILDRVPEPTDMFDRMVKCMVAPSYNLKTLAQDSRRQGRQIDKYLSQASSHILHSRA